MFSFNLVRWLKSRFRSRGKTVCNKPRLRLHLEELESRLAPASVWTGAVSNNWNNAGTPTTWAQGGAASFGGGTGSGGSINLGQAIQVSSMTFNKDGYITPAFFALAQLPENDHWVL